MRFSPVDPSTRPIPVWQKRPFTPERAPVERELGWGSRILLADAA
jgi:hypothetical protein